MRFSPSLLEDIKARVPVSEIVGAKVRFDPKKSNQARGDYWGCCPFHTEKTPSFHCDDRRGRYHCFGCGASGDIFRFLTETEGVSFFEAVERLAQRAGVALPAPDPQSAQREQERLSLYDVMEQAAQFYQRALAESGGAAARAYLRQRGVSEAAQKQFRIGFAPGGNNALKQFFHQHKIAADLQEKSGLLAVSDEDGNRYDRFRNRIMFPILDARSRVIAFGGRALDAQARAKYLNSPETELFSKGRVLYNFASARAALFARGQETARWQESAEQSFIVAEGYLDVVALAQAGFGAALAPLGTALTEEQLGLLWRACPEPVLCFDGDRAGRQAAFRALERALPLLRTGISLRFALLPEGQDPDDVIRAGGRAEFARILAQALPPAEILWLRETEGRSFSAPESRAALQKRLQDAFGLIQDSGLRYYYLQDMRQKLWEKFRSAPRGGGQAGAQAGGGQWARQGGNWGGKAHYGQSGGLVTSTLAESRFVRAAGAKGGAGFAPREGLILALLAACPALWQENFDILAGLEIESAELRGFHRAMLEILAESAAEGAPLAAPAFAKRLAEKGQEQTAKRLTVFLGGLGVKTEADSMASAAMREALNQALALYQRAHALRGQIRETEADILREASGEGSGAGAAFARLRALREELRKEDSLPAAPDEI